LVSEVGGRWRAAAVSISFWDRMSGDSRRLSTFVYSVKAIAFVVEVIYHPCTRGLEGMGMRSRSIHVQEESRGIVYYAYTSQGITYLYTRGAKGLARK
jgi:hypothetical protein